MPIQRCERCETEKPTWHFARWVSSSRDHWCRPCKAADPPGWKREVNRRYNLLKKYGLYREDVQRLRGLRPGCWCCGRTDQVLQVDHCHTTGRVRGLLCAHCNAGTMGDDVVHMRRRLAYLELPLPDIPVRPLESYTSSETKHPLHCRYRDLGICFRSQGFRPDEWLYFEGFLLWAEAAGWREGMYLLRRGGDGFYVPDNCYWSTTKVPLRFGPRDGLLRAWGEEKKPSEWLDDSRCVLGPAGRELLFRRVQRGWTPELALTTTVTEAKRHAQFAGRNQSAFGEARTLTEWAADPRCVVSYVTMTQRVRQGWPLERALTTAARDGVHELHGEVKRAGEWLADPRCKVTSYNTLAQRLQAGWGFEEALTIPDGRTLRGRAARGRTVKREPGDVEHPDDEAPSP